MKNLVICIGIVLSLAIGFFVGNTYKFQKDENYNEDVIQKEISLLIKYKDQPACSEVTLNSDRLYTLKTDDVVIVWKYYPEMATLQKVLISKEFVVAHDKLKVISGNNTCEFVPSSDEK